jgi:hypothetical protein
VKADVVFNKFVAAADAFAHQVKALSQLGKREAIDPFGSQPGCGRLEHPPDLKYLDHAIFLQQIDC